MGIYHSGPVYHNNKGNSLYNLGRYEEAIDEYNIAIELDPDNPVYHNNKKKPTGKVGMKQTKEAW